MGKKLFRYELNVLLRCSLYVTMSDSVNCWPSNYALLWYTCRKESFRKRGQWLQAYIDLA